MNRIIDLRVAFSTEYANASGHAETLRRTRQLPDSHRIAFITPVKDEMQYEICLRHLNSLDVPSGYSVEKIAVLGGSSMAEVYQRAMEATSARYKIYLHVDGYVIHEGMLLEILNLFRTYPRLGLVGVEGATQLPTRVLYSVNNPLHIYGRIWNYRRPGGPLSLLGRANRRRLHFERFRSFVGDYLPAVVVDGFFMATQYDIPWVHPEFGFDWYETVQSLEFIKAGLEVGIARQEAVWCIHWGPLREPPREQHIRRQIKLHREAAVFAQLYPGFIRVSARRLYERHRDMPEWMDMFVGNSPDRVTTQRTTHGDARSPSHARERLGIIIATLNGKETLLRALRALLPQCETLNVEYGVVVVETEATHGTVEVLRGEFPHVTVLSDDSHGGLAGGFNMGLRHLGFPSYVLVMQDVAEFSDGALVKMVGHLREHLSIAGIVATRIDSSGTVQSQRTAIVELVKRRPLRLQEVSFVANTCVLVRGDVFFDVGLYDERFQSCHEDLDWSIRAKRKGYRFVLLPEARVILHSGLGSRQDNPATFKRLITNLRLVYKHAGRRWAIALYWAQWLQAKWLAIRWRNDHEALRQLNDAVVHMEVLYRKFREENRRPQLL